MTTATETLTPAEKLDRIQRIRALDGGQVHIAPACPFCLSTRIEPETDDSVHCNACGRTSKLTKVHTIRKQRLSRYIRTGQLR